MPEKNESTPITRGVEIRTEQVRKIREKALALYRRLVALSVEHERQLKDELEKPAEHSNTQRTEELEHALEKDRQIEAELDDIILGSFENEDALLETWGKLTERLKQ